MSCNSAIYCANSTAQETLTNAAINFGNVVRRFGPNLGTEGGNPVIKGTGYYSIDTNFDIIATGTSTTIALYKDGNPIAGASSTITTASGNAYSVSIPAIVRQTCCCEAPITAIINAGTINSASIGITKL